MNKKNLISKFGLRLDGRKPEELRRIRCSLGIYSNHDGSAYYEQGITKVIAVVSGPQKVRKGNTKSAKCRVHTKITMARFATTDRKKTSRNDRKTLDLILRLNQALESSIDTELFPGSIIHICLEVLEAGSGTFAACINAATLAIIDAGIPIMEPLVACTASIVNDVPILDLSSEESTSGIPVLTIGTLPLSKKIGFLEISQKIHLSQLPKLIDMTLHSTLPDTFTEFIQRNNNISLDFQTVDNKSKEQ